MTSSKNTKRALLASVLSVMLCCAMLVGSTFAWFTDSVTSGGNQIIAGNLKVDLIHVDDGEEVSIKETPTHKIFNYDKWEPGYTVMETLKVVNKGNLAFKFRLDAVAAGATAAPTGEKLADVIDVWVYEGEGIPTTKSFAEMTKDANWRNAGSLSTLMADPDGIARGVLLPENTTPTNGEPVKEVQMTVALHMQEDAGNAYQGLTLGDLNFTLRAAQYTYEKDGFGDDQYDKDAIYYDRAVSTAEEFVAALDDPEVTYIAVSEDITFDWGRASYENSNALKLRNKVISGVTGSETLTFAGYGSANPIKDVTLSNITVKDETKGDNEGSWEHGYLEFENLTATNVTFIDQINLAGNCSLAGCQLNGTEAQYALWVQSGNVSLTNCTLSGMRMLKIHEAYGSEVTSVVVDACTFNGTNEKAGIDFGTLNADTSVTIRNSTFTNCDGIYEGDTPIEDFTFVEENNTVN